MTTKEKQKTPNQLLVESWKDVLDDDSTVEKVEGYDKRVAVAQLLENQVREGGEYTGLLMEAGEPTNSVSAGGVQNSEPVLINLVRRMMPKLVAFDFAGVQVMKAPTQLIFALKSHYNSPTGDEALFNEADTAFSGTGTHSGSNPTEALSTGKGMTTAEAEGKDHWNEMGFSIESTNAQAVARQLKASYSIEMATDLRNVHNLDADLELTTILQTEIIAEMNREFTRTVYSSATLGATSATTAGTFDLATDSDGRWSAEKFKGLIFQIDRDANAIYTDTKRGKGNVILCSADVASALMLAGVLDYSPLLKSNGMNIDVGVTTYVGNYRGMYKVYIDPYATEDFYLVGYKGSSKFDAGMFYCPYVPLQQLRAQDQDTFQPVVGFKTRYALVANPFTSLDANQNTYYRKAKVTNIL